MRAGFPLNGATALQLWPFVVYFVAVIALVATMLGLGWLLGPRRLDPSTIEPYESGIVPVGSAHLPISVEFYLIAIFFVLFDLETVFIFAWAVAFIELGWAGYCAMLVFIGVLVVALAYAWRTGAFEWGHKTRFGLPSEER